MTYTMTRATDDDGKIWFTFAAKAYPQADPLVLSPDDFQSGAKMRARVLAWVAGLS